MLLLLVCIFTRARGLRQKSCGSSSFACLPGKVPRSWVGVFSLRTWLVHPLLLDGDRERVRASRSDCDGDGDGDGEGDAEDEGHTHEVTAGKERPQRGKSKSRAQQIEFTYRQKTHTDRRTNGVRMRKPLRLLYAGEREAKGSAVTALRLGPGDSRPTETKLRWLPPRPPSLALPPALQELYCSFETPLPSRRGLASLVRYSSGL